MRANILVLANQTATSDELLGRLEERAAKMPLRLELVVPPTAPGDASREQAELRLEQALQRFQEAGFEATGRVGDDCDALAVAVDAYDPARHDEIIVSTLPASISRWMGIDLPARVMRVTNALVTHVTASEPRPARAAVS